jgi:hypothetical protein
MCESDWKWFVYISMVSKLSFQAVKVFKVISLLRKIVILKSLSCQWLTPVILATQEADIRRIMVQSQPRQMVRETVSQKYSSQLIN